MSSNRPFVVLFGRGKTGKSTVARLLAERAREAGRDFALADAERTTDRIRLADFYEGVLAPEFTTEVEIAEWYDALVNAAVDDKVPVILDTAGGDTTFLDFARSVDLCELLAEQGIDPVAVHVLGSDPNDLVMLRAAVAAGFRPAHTILVLNDVDGRGATTLLRQKVFERITGDRTYADAIKAGAKVVHLGKLPCMWRLVRDKWTFAQAARDLSLTDRQRLVVWRRQAEAELAGVSEWLP